MEPGDAWRQTLTVARKFGEPLFAVHMNALDPFSPDALATVLQRAADALEASAVLAAGTERGNEGMARLAARTGLPFAPNCGAVAPVPPVTVTRLRRGATPLEAPVLHPTQPPSTTP